MAALHCALSALVLVVGPAGAQVVQTRLYAASDGPGDLATGDLNGDGLADLVTGGTSIAVLLRAPDGGLLPPTFIVSGPNESEYVSLGHLDADGTLDLVYVHDAGPTDTLEVRLGDGAGGFGAAFSLPIPSSADDVELADVDGDGDDDVAVTGLSGNHVDLFRSDGVGGLVAVATLTTGNLPRGIGAGDLDADGDIDLATANILSDSLSLFRNTPAGFVPAGTLLHIESPAEVLIGDADEDGDADLFVGGPDVALYLGHGDFTFGAYEVIAQFGFSLQLVDIDGNGYEDLVMFSGGGIGLRALPGGPGPEFGPDVVGVPVGPAPSSVVLMEVDDDGLLDAVVGSDSGHHVLVLTGLGFAKFEEYQLSKVDGRPAAFEATDLDGDFDVDVAIASVGYFGPGTTTVLLNDGAGVLSPVTTPPLSSDTLDIVAGDVDADGDKDLLSVRAATGLNVQLGDGSGGFGAATVYPIGPFPLFVDVGDLDGDGDDDAAVKYELSGAPGGPAGIFLADGTGGLGLPSTVKVGQSDAGVVLADVTLDGSLDLLGIADSQGVKVFPGQGTGAFGPPVVSALGADVVNLAVADLDVDGLPDLVVLRGTPGVQHVVSVLSGDGSGAFVPDDELPADTYSRGLGLGDVDADGFPEILTTGLGVAYLFRNDGAGGFLPPTVHVAGASPMDVAPVEFDGDGLVDVVVFSFATYESSEITLLSNTGPPQSWTWLGQGSAGSDGIPMLIGKGPLIGGTPIALELAGAPRLSPAALVLGLAPLFAPLKGGVLVPAPDVLVTGLVTDDAGGTLLEADWPAGLPAGVQLWFQFWIADAAASDGSASSNGLSALTP